MVIGITASAFIYVVFLGNTKEREEMNYEMPEMWTNAQTEQKEP